jgi:hypothetical protein
MGIGIETLLNTLGKGLQQTKGYGAEPWGAGLSALSKGLSKRREEKEEEQLTEFLIQMLPPGMQEQIKALGEKPTKGISGILETILPKLFPSTTMSFSAEDLTQFGKDEFAKTGQLPQPQEETGDPLAAIAALATQTQDMTMGVPGKDFPLEDTPLGKAVFQRRPTKLSDKEKQYNFLRGKGITHDEAMAKVYPSKQPTATMEKFKVSEKEKKEAKVLAKRESEERKVTSFFEFSIMNGTLSKSDAGYLMNLYLSGDQKAMAHAKKIKKALERVNERKTIHNLTPEEYKAEINQVLSNIQAF